MKQPDIHREHAELLIRKATEDENLLKEVIDSPKVSDEIFGFHCQQASEKLLKALLASRQVVYRKTHDLDELIILLSRNGIILPEEFDDLSVFSTYAVEYRYEEWPPEAESLDRAGALNMVRNLRVWVEVQV